MNKKEEVINAARDLFTKYGYKKVSMDEIAKEANVTKKTIYSYFSDKEAMFKYFASEELQSMKEKIENDVNSSTSFIDKVSKILYESLQTPCVPPSQKQSGVVKFKWHIMKNMALHLRLLLKRYPKVTLQNAFLF